MRVCVCVRVIVRVYVRNLKWISEVIYVLGECVCKGTVPFFLLCTSFQQNIPGHWYAASLFEIHNNKNIIPATMVTQYYLQHSMFALPRPFLLRNWARVAQGLGGTPEFYIFTLKLYHLCINWLNRGLGFEMTDIWSMPNTKRTVTWERCLN